MAGLISIALLAAWLFITLRVARKTTAHLKAGATRTTLFILLTALLFVLPVADEIVGGFQFRALCKQGAVLKLEPEKIKGRALKVVVAPSNFELSNTAIPIYHSHLSYRDVQTGEELASYSRYTARGGLLSQVIAGVYGSPPFTIFPPTCTPGLPQEYKQNVINP